MSRSLVGASLLLAALLLAGCGGGSPGTYQFATASGHGGFTYVVACDTTNGKTWITSDRGSSWTAFDAPPEARPGRAGNYAVDLHLLAEYVEVFVCDTRTGRCWASVEGKNWVEYKGPPK